MSIPNAVLQGQHNEFYATQQNEFFNYIENSGYFTLDEGFMTIDESPGLGIQIDEEYVREQAKKKTSWKEPTWHYEDGSVANW
jgi:galactonate dehydratase